MKKLLFFVSLIFTICANAQIDSLNYALGYQMMREMLDRDLPFMQTAEDSIEMYHGIERNMPTPEMAKDSAYTVNYAMGAFNGYALAYGLKEVSKEDLPPVDCIIDGLQMVVGNHLILPNDTIEARLILESCPDSIQLAQLSSEERCDFYTAYGVLIGFPIGLDQFMEVLGVANMEPNYQYYAQGLSDALDFILQMATPPENAYDYGKWLILYLRVLTAHDMCLEMADGMSEIITWEFNSSDFLSGIRAAFGLEELKLSVDEMDSVLERE